MTTPADAPLAPPSNLQIENVTKSAVVYGNNNTTTVINDSPGAKVIVANSSLQARRREGRVAVLPRKPGDFVGRQADIDLLRQAVTDSPVVSLWADNGMGKSALARKLCNSLSEADPSRNIAYLELTNLHGDDLLLALYDLFYERPIPDSKPSRTQMLLDLQGAKALVFADNLDLSANNVDSLVNAAPQCSFILISTKRALADGKALRLQGLPDSDSIQLFSEPFEQEQRPLDDAGKQAGIHVCELLKGIPDLIIRVAMRGVNNEETPGQLLEALKAAGVDDVSLANFTTATLSPNEKKVLMFLAVAGEDITVPAKLLEALHDRFPDLDVAAVLDRLQTLHLAQSHSPRYSLCGALPSVLAGAWDLTAARDEMLDIAMNWLPAQQASEPVEDSLPLMQRVLSDAAERQKWPEVIKLGRPLERLVFRYMRWQAWADVLGILLRAARATANAALEGWALHQVGSRGLAEGMLDVASANLSQALKIRESLNDKPGLEVTQHNLDVLKALSAPARGNAGVKRGGHSLAYGFFGFAGLVALALAGYAIFRPKPAVPVAQPVVPPVAVTTAAPLLATDTPAATSTAPATEASTSVPIDTPTGIPTGIPVTQAPFGATVTGVDFLACRYGPGSVYLYYGLVGLKNGDPLDILGHADTALGQWALVHQPQAGTRIVPCWVSVKYLQTSGDISQSPKVDAHYVFPLFTDPKYVPGVFPYPTVTDTSRDGSLVQVSAEGKDLVYISESHTDRESASSPLFLVEFWVCQNGRQLIDPQGIYFQYDPSQPTAAGSAVATDDGSCGQPVHGDVYLAHRDGYVGPVPFQIAP